MQQTIDYAIQKWILQLLREGKSQNLHKTLNWSFHVWWKDHLSLNRCLHFVNRNLFISEGRRNEPRELKVRHHFKFTKSITTSFFCSILELGADYDWLCWTMHFQYIVHNVIYRPWKSSLNWRKSWKNQHLLWDGKMNEILSLFLGWWISSKR